MNTKPDSNATKLFAILKPLHDAQNQALFDAINKFNSNIIEQLERIEKRMDTIEILVNNMAKKIDNTPYSSEAELQKYNSNTAHTGNKLQQSNSIHNREHSTKNTLIHNMCSSNPTVIRKTVIVRNAPPRDGFNSDSDYDVNCD